jgi:hypothetical protein
MRTAILEGFEGYPLPHPLQSLAGHGVRKKSLQNLGGKELRGQNPENIGLSPLCSGGLYCLRLGHDGLTAEGWQG